MNKKPNPRAISYKHKTVLFKLAKRFSPVLEIGIAYGDGSTEAISEAIGNSNSLHISVDAINILKDEYIPKNKNWHFVQCSSTNASVIEKISEIYNGLFELIFIDTLHTYDQMKIELSIFNKIASENTVWVFHDTWMTGKCIKMTEAIKEFAKENDLVYWDYDTRGPGLGIVTSKSMLESVKKVMT